MKVGDEIEYQGRRYKLTGTYVNEEGLRFFWLDNQQPPIWEYRLEHNLDAD